MCKETRLNAKGFLSVLEKCLEIEKDLKAPKDQRERDDMFQKLVEENIKEQEQLKWKKEEFKLLEEAHEKHSPLSVK